MLINPTKVFDIGYCFIPNYQVSGHNELSYFFGYKTEFFFFQNIPKDLDPSYKMDLDLLDCLGRVNLVF